MIRSIDLLSLNGRFLSEDFALLDKDEETLQDNPLLLEYRAAIFSVTNALLGLAANTSSELVTWQTVDRNSLAVQQNSLAAQGYQFEGASEPQTFHPENFYPALFWLAYGRFMQVRGGKELHIQEILLPYIKNYPIR